MRTRVWKGGWPSWSGGQPFPGSAVVTKQTRTKHAEHIRTLERTMRAICELIFKARPKVQEPTGRTQQVGLLPPLEVMMRGESFPMPPPVPQLLAQRSAQPQSAKQWQEHASPPTGLLPSPATLKAGEQFPIWPPAPQLLAQLDPQHGHSHQHHQHHH